MSNDNNNNGNNDNDDGFVEHGENNVSKGLLSAQSILNKIFTSCDDDPKGSVHRAWGISLIFVLIYFIISIFELLNLRGKEGSIALIIGTIWTGLIHLILAILGTFVLKRFPTNFSIGFFLGVLSILVNQNLILFATFHGYHFGNKLSTNHIFANLCLTMCIILAFFTLLLVNFRNDVVVAPIDVKGFNNSNNKDNRVEEGTATSDYQSYNEK